MNTPICDFAKRYAASDALRLHMPGHKGVGTLGIERLDLTEINGADVLYSGDGIIAESEKNAALLFGSKKTLYSAEGSSLSIRAMLFLASLWGKENGLANTILAGRNAHRVFHGACALLDIDVDFICDGGIMDCAVTAEALEEVLEGYEKKPCAVYLTSPDYLGNTLDIEALSSVCHRHGVLCLVDNAHGAYLKFLSPSRHPLDLGADACADSAHKTLPALTGAAYLHISKNAPAILSEQAESAMALFASTSPSYLILQSLDALNAYLLDGYREKLSKWVSICEGIKVELQKVGYETAGNETIKITLCPKSYGYTGEQIGNILEKNGIVCEHSDPDFTVLMLNPSLDESVADRLLSILLSLPKGKKIEALPPRLTKKERAVSMREALLSPKESIPASLALGRITADSATACPPAVPITVCGEIIDDDAIKAFEYYGIEHVNVIK